MQAEGTALTETPPRSTVSRRGSIGLLIAVAIVGYGLDQVSKWWAAGSLDPFQPRDLIGGLLKLHLTFNPGAAFSIGTNATWVLTLIACAVIAATIFFARRLHSRAWAVGLGLLIGGALGNLTDRFFRTPGAGRGHVVDFLELPHWPIFNVADICVVTAACLIALLSIRGIAIDGSRADRGEGSDATDE